MARSLRDFQTRENMPASKPRPLVFPSPMFNRWWDLTRWARFTELFLRMDPLDIVLAVETSVWVEKTKGHSSRTWMTEASSDTLPSDSEVEIAHCPSDCPAPNTQGPFSELLLWQFLQSSLSFQSCVSSSHHLLHCGSSNSLGEMLKRLLLLEKTVVRKRKHLVDRTSEKRSLQSHTYLETGYSGRSAVKSSLVLSQTSGNSRQRRGMGLCESTGELT